MHSGIFFGLMVLAACLCGCTSRVHISAIDTGVVPAMLPDQYHVYGIADWSGPTTSTWPGPFCVLFFRSDRLLEDVGREHSIDPRCMLVLESESGSKRVEINSYDIYQIRPIDREELSALAELSDGPVYKTYFPLNLQPEWDTERDTASMTVEELKALTGPLSIRVKGMNMVGWEIKSNLLPIPVQLREGQLVLDDGKESSLTD